jgi:malonate-semialdehyde dehydrogenase (acetylating)/methylmalonate-semialdehyde dehydrogenase
MFRFKQLLEEHADEIAAAITDEHGKVFDDAMGEFGRGVEVVDYACGIPELLKGEYSRNATFPPWSRCGCIRWQSLAVTRSY